MAGHCEFILQSNCFGGPTPPTDQTTCHGQTFRTCPAVLKCGERHPAAGRWPGPCGSGLVPNRAGPRVVPKASICGADPSPLRGFGVPSLPSSALRGSVLVNVPCGCFSCLAAFALLKSIVCRAWRAIRVAGGVDVRSWRVASGGVVLRSIAPPELCLFGDVGPSRAHSARRAAQAACASCWGPPATQPAAPWATPPGGGAAPSSRRRGVPGRPPQCAVSRRRGSAEGARS